MKIKTAYIIETLIRLLLSVLMFPFIAVGWILLQLAKPFEWLTTEIANLMDRFGRYLFIKSKMNEYVKNPTYRNMLTARKAYKLKKQVLKEQPHLSANDF